MYHELEQKLREEFPELPQYEEKFWTAYKSAKSIIGNDNATAIENEVRKALNDELAKYLASNPKSRLGLWIRKILKIFSTKK